MHFMIIFFSIWFFRSNPINERKKNPILFCVRFRQALPVALINRIVPRYLYSILQLIDASWSMNITLCTCAPRISAKKCAHHFVFAGFWPTMPHIIYFALFCVNVYWARVGLYASHKVISIAFIYFWLMMINDGLKSGKIADNRHCKIEENSTVLSGGKDRAPIQPKSTTKKLSR